MAPIATSTMFESIPLRHSFNSDTSGAKRAPLDRKLFPDGLKTSGQHAPVESALLPYEKFPKHISGPTVWTGEDYSDQPERWTHSFSPDEVAELAAVADQFIASGTPLTRISKELFPLPTLGQFFAEVRDEIINARGFILFKNLPVAEWGLHKSAVVYMGLGTYFGYFSSQNRHGHVLGHVKDLGEDLTQSDRVRVYRTNGRQFFHTDGADLVGLLCIARSLEGGESDIASTHEIFNTLQREHPEVVETFTKPIWYFDRKGEVSEGQLPYYRSCVFFMENDPNSSTRRLYSRLDPNNVTSLKRFSTGPDAQIPPLSEEQIYALNIFEKTAKRLSLHMILEPGDVQLLANTHVFHARTAYKDWPAGSVDERGQPRVRRHLMRLWLATPEQEGGWRLANPDSREKKRGGIQVDYNPPTSPLDAE